LVHIAARIGNDIIGAAAAASAVVTAAAITSTTTKITIADG